MIHGVGVGGRSKGLLRDRGFRFFLLARAVSLLGSSVTEVVLPLLVYQRTGSALQTGLLATTEAIPYVILGPFAGVVSDRVRRQGLLIAFDLLSAATLSTIPIAYALNLLSPPMVFVVAFVAGACFVWYDAGLFGAVPALVGKERLVQANPILQATSTLAGVLGPALGGILAASIGAARAISVDAFSFACSAVLLVFVRQPLTGMSHPGDANRRGRLWAEMSEGLAFLWSDQVIRVLVEINLVLSMAGGAVFGLLVVYATRGLGVSSHSPLIGLIYAASALGGFGGALYSSVLGQRLGPGRAVLWSLAANPALLVGMATVPDFWFALPMTTLWVVSYSGVTINGITARQLRIPERMQGRVNTSARIFGWGLGWPVGAALGGMLAQELGVRSTYALVAAAVALLAGAAWRSRLRSAQPPSAGPRAIAE